MWWYEEDLKCVMKLTWIQLIHVSLFRHTMKNIYYYTMTIFTIQASLHEARVLNFNGDKVNIWHEMYAKWRNGECQPALKLGTRVFKEYSWHLVDNLGSLTRWLQLWTFYYFIILKYKGELFCPEWWFNGELCRKLAGRVPPPMPPVPLRIFMCGANLFGLT